MKTATRSSPDASSGISASAIYLPEPGVPAPALHVEPLRTDSQRDWQRFVDSHEHTTLFHELAWRQAVETCFPHRAHYLLARRGEEIAGILPLFEIRSHFSPTFLLSMPYATYGGIAAENGVVANALFDAACALREQIGAAGIQLRSERAMVSDLPVQKTHAAFRGPLPNCEYDVPAVFPRKARAAARQAGQRYPLVVENDAGNLRDVWRLYARSMRRLGSPNYPLNFFQALQRGFGDRCVVQLLRLEGRPVAGLISFLFKDAIMPYFVGVDERVKLYGLTHYLYQQCMLEGVRRGCSVFDFGRTRYDNKGPFDFKRHCGFEPTPLEYQTLVPNGARSPELSPTSARWQLARRVWRYLPLSITRPVGAWAARSIPG